MQSKKITNKKKKEKNCKGSSYIDKIKEIMVMGEMESFSDEQLIDKKPNCANTGQLDEEEKQMKSRQSARDTRKRRKLYMQLLEKKVVSLSEELDATKKKCLLLESKVLAHQNSEIMNKVQNERKKLFDKLEYAIKSGEELEINCIMDSLRLRLGIAGKTRLLALQSIFNEAINMMMPFHMKYLFHIACNKLDIFRDDLDTDSVDSSTWFSGTVTSEKEIRKIQNDILSQKKSYDQILNHFNEIRKAIQIQNETSQDFIDDLRNTFPIINVAKFLLDLDRKRGHYIHDKIYPEQYWSDLMDLDHKTPHVIPEKQVQISPKLNPSNSDEINPQIAGGDQQAQLAQKLHQSNQSNYSNKEQQSLKQQQQQQNEQIQQNQGYQSQQFLEKKLSNNSSLNHLYRSNNNINNSQDNSLVLDQNIVNNSLVYPSANQLQSNNNNQSQFNNQQNNNNPNNLIMQNNNNNNNNNNNYNGYGGEIFFPQNTSFDYNLQSNKKSDDLKQTDISKDINWFKEYN